VLEAAGFRLGNGKRLTKYFRPSRLASRVWRHGLQLDGEAVDIRIVNTSGVAVQDHFVDVWGKEGKAPLRVIRKLYDEARRKIPRPPIAMQEFGMQRTWTGPGVKVSINRPTWLGVLLSFRWGRHPEYRVQIPGFGGINGLKRLEPFPDTPAQPFSRMSKFKRDVLFRPAVVRLVIGSRPPVGMSTRAFLSMLHSTCLRPRRQSEPTVHSSVLVTRFVGMSS
jgi:hypothetical protein